MTKVAKNSTTQPFDDSTKMIAIKIEGLSKKYKNGFSGERRVLDNLTLTVNQGEIFGFLGPNGAGKTTTLKLLTGLIFPTSGKAFIFEKEPADPSLKSLVGFLPENPQFHRYLTAEELLIYYGELFSLGSKEIRKRIDYLLKLVNLENERHVLLNKFSKGMIQRIGIAQLILNDPELIILDEPMAGLDPMGRKMVGDILIKMKKEGKTVFFSSHILNDAESLCDRVAILEEGKLSMVDSVENLLNLSSENPLSSLEDVFIERTAN